MKQELIQAMLRYLRYSFDPIDFRYPSLTAEEKKILTQDEFDAICEAIKNIKP